LEGNRLESDSIEKLEGNWKGGIKMILKKHVMRMGDGFN
jgi:hypothetical protein